MRIEDKSFRGSTIEPEVLAAIRPVREMIGHFLGDGRVKKVSLLHYYHDWDGRNFVVKYEIAGQEIDPVSATRIWRPLWQQIEEELRVSYGIDWKRPQKKRVSPPDSEEDFEETFYRHSTNRGGIVVEKKIIDTHLGTWWKRSLLMRRLSVEERLRQGLATSVAAGRNLFTEKPPLVIG